MSSVSFREPVCMCRQENDPHHHDVFHDDLLLRLFPDERKLNVGRGRVAFPLDTSTDDPETPEEFFCRFVQYNFNETAKIFGCNLNIHQRRCNEARDLWRKDLERVLDQVNNADHLDQFKRAGFLAYWLRRQKVTDEILEINHEGAPPDTTDFMLYGNEICAFRLGYQFCFQDFIRNFLTPK